MSSTPADVSLTDPTELARAAAKRLRELTGVERHDVALVMGSGWVLAGAVAVTTTLNVGAGIINFGSNVQNGVSVHVSLMDASSAEIASTDLPGFAPPAVAGHAG